MTNGADWWHAMLVPLGMFNHITQNPSNLAGKSANAGVYNNKSKDLIGLLFKEQKATKRHSFSWKIKVSLCEVLRVIDSAQAQVDITSSECTELFPQPKYKRKYTAPVGTFGLQNFSKQKYLPLLDSIYLT